MASNKSILGSSFDSFVSKQLDTRSTLLSTNRQDLKQIQYALKTGFIRLTSSVNIEDEKLAVYLGSLSYKGDGLARQNILFGGTLGPNGLRGGLTNPNASYTKSELGLRPMAGITSANVISRGRWGSLRDTTITIKCSDRNQLSIVEVLYCRPGYTILLEWGHSLSYDNNSKLINNINFIDMFNKTVDKNKIYEQILAKREQYSGNYDGFIGPVMNFNIKENSDGSYDVMVKAVSWGQIIESIKINTSANSTNSSDNITNSFAIKEELDNSRIESILKTFYNVGNQKDSQNKKVSLLESYNQYFDTDPLGHSINKDATPINKEELTTLINIPFNYSSLTPNSTIYIKLGSLLSLISRNCLLYTTPNEDSKVIDKSIPIININFNENDNFCFSAENHISMDPRICMIKYNGPNFPEIGLDDRVLNSKINSLLPEFKKFPLVGKTMNIMISINYLLDKLKTVKDDGSINLYEFLKSLMDDINLSLGRVNDFNIGMDDETNTLSIYDNQILANSPKEMTSINTLGLKSSVRDIWIDSKINNNLASLIAIGAQASGTGAGLDASILSEYNKGIKDRISPNRKSVDNIGDLSTQDYIKTLTNDRRVETIKRTIENIYINNKLIPEDINQCINFYADILNTLKAKNRDSIAIIPFTYNIRMDGLSGIKYGQLFTVETIRLPKNYININNKNLPAIAFLATNIDHNIEDNTWTTTISGQMAPIREGLTVKK